ncbi:kinase domain-containing protein [Penicillium coprophilum]|uniref:kinase domain-containing protein n=1 Tax=Penicillium coprophilum TaxID=36646 RepID=UPI00238959D6|nr:kinase domain-containing protein [Penicillium coprophilum]KAJ5158556.1 kinase domain-containing protein [Penicillium coprophilum]
MARSQPLVRFFLPRHWRDQPPVATDLFVLGSTLYEFTQGTSPYEEVPSDEAEGLFTQKEFPDISHTLSGIVIKQFWPSQIESAADVQNSTWTIIFRTANVDCIPHPDDPGTAQDMLIDPLIPPRVGAVHAALSCFDTSM